MHIDADTLNKFARQLFYNLLRIGFRNIYVFFHHQSENFVSGMPTRFTEAVSLPEMKIENKIEAGRLINPK